MTKKIVAGNSNFVVDDDGSVALYDPLTVQPTGNEDPAMTVGDGTAFDIHALWVDLQFLHDGQNDAGEGLVDFPALYISGSPAGTRERPCAARAAAPFPRAA